MQIKSNIPAVIAMLKAYRDGIAGALQRVIRPERWFAQLHDAAEMALLSEASVDEAWAVPKFLEMMGSAFFGNTSKWWMSSPAGNDSEALASAVEVARRTAPDWRPGSTIEATQLDLIDKMTVDQAMQLIKEWIEQGGKNLTAEDEALMQRQGLYDNLLVERIWHIFGIHPGDVGRFEVGDGQEEAIQKLTPHIVEFFSGQSAQGLPTATVDLWLRKILAVWTEHMKNNLPAAIEEEFKKLRTR